MAVSERPLHVADGENQEGLKTEGTKSEPQVLTFRQFLPHTGQACGGLAEQSKQDLCSQRAHLKRPARAQNTLAQWKQQL